MLYIAHRGGAALGPENTLAAMRQALARNVSWIEIDVYAVAGQVVVFHDSRLERTTDGRGRIADCSLDYLHTLDAGDGERIPLLAETLELVAGRARLNIELKGPHSSDPTLALLQRAMTRGAGEWGDGLVSSFDQRQLALLHERQPQLPLGVLLAGPSLHYVQDCIALGARSVHMAIDYVDRSFVDDAHAHGLQVLVYTVDDEDDMARMAALGVDGIFCDRPPRQTE